MLSDWIKCIHVFWSVYRARSHPTTLLTISLAALVSYIYSIHCDHCSNSLETNQSRTTRVSLCSRRMKWRIQHSICCPWWSIRNAYARLHWMVTRKYVLHCTQSTKPLVHHHITQSVQDTQMLTEKTRSAYPITNHKIPNEPWPMVTTVLSKTRGRKTTAK